MNHKLLSRREFVGLTLAVAAWPSLAQTYPSRPPRVLVGYAAGGGMDTMARILTQRLTPVLGQSFVVENRGGAAGMLAADIVAKSPADGYTLLYGESGLLIASLVQQKAALDPLKAFAPVAGTFQSRLMLVANNEFPANNPKEFIELLKKNPGRYSYGTSGVGTVHHLGMELMKSRTGTFILHIPYRGVPQIITDVINGQLAVGVVSASAGIAQMRSGRLKGIAMLTASKAAGAEDVPSMADVLPGFSVGPRQMLLAPAGTPAPVIERLAEAVRTVLASPETVQAARQQGVDPGFMAAAPLATDLTRESTAWAQVIKSQKIVIE